MHSAVSLLRVGLRAALRAPAAAAPARRALSFATESAPAEALRRLRLEDPKTLINRVESGRYELDEAVFNEYTEALIDTGAFNRRKVRDLYRLVAESRAAGDAQDLGALRKGLSSRGSSGFGALSSSGPVAAEEAAGARVVYVNAPGGAATAPSFREGMWKTVRSIATVFLILVGVHSLMDDGTGARSGGPASGGLARMLSGLSQEPTPVSDARTTFDDVRGADEAKEEMREVVEYLRSPEQFTQLGGHLPKGILLTGSPGNGKTLLARAVAGEAGVPFFYASGSEFEEVFVGVGAKRIRDLFAAARKHAPCIIFLDEIDAIGAKRSSRDMNYTRMTLNQLLVELDGFKSSEGIIVIAATNLPEIMDNALLRPGRFDKQIHIALPDIRGRTDILNLYASRVRLGTDVQMEVIARSTVGFSGADLENLMNQAAIRAAVRKSSVVEMTDLEFAKDRILMGAERKSAVLTDESKRLTAYHEGGHAIAALFTQGALPIHKATIVPRGSALGMVMQLPGKDQTSITRQQLLARLDVCMGGRVAEELIFGADHITTGASSDFQQATQLATDMVLRYGMSDSVGIRVLPNNEERSLQSQHTQELTDREIKRLLDESYARVKKLLRARERELHSVARALLERETLSGDEVKSLLHMQ